MRINWTWRRSLPTYFQNTWHQRSMIKFKLNYYCTAIAVWIAAQYLKIWRLEQHINMYVFKDNIFTFLRICASNLLDYTVSPNTSRIRVKAERCLLIWGTSCNITADQWGTLLYLIDIQFNFRVTCTNLMKIT